MGAFYLKQKRGTLIQVKRNIILAVVLLLVVAVGFWRHAPQKGIVVASRAHFTESVPASVASIPRVHLTLIEFFAGL